MSNDEKATKGSKPPSLIGPNERVAPAVETQEGVKKIEALQRVWLPNLKIALYIAIALAR